jgi:hypothetical protein
MSLQILFLRESPPTHRTTERLQLQVEFFDVTIPIAGFRESAMAVRAWKDRDSFVV